MKHFLFMYLLVISNSLLADTRSEEEINLNFTGNDFYCLAHTHENAQMFFKNSQISDHTGHKHDYLSASFGTADMCLDAIRELNNEYRGRVVVKLIKVTSTTYKEESYSWQGTCVSTGGHDRGSVHPCQRQGTRQVPIYNETVSITLSGNRFSHSL
jgi:hypothetical protein